MILDNIYANVKDTEFTVENNKAKLIQGIQLQGHGGAFYTKTQISKLENNLEKWKISKYLILNQEYMFSEHLHDIKLYKYSLDNTLPESNNIYVLVLCYFMFGSCIPIF